MRRKLIAGNWKMNKTLSEAHELLLSISNNINSDILKNVDVLVCPPFISLSIANFILKDSLINIGGQNIYQENEGAYTGEISAKLLTSVGCKYVIVGHSERRQYFFETNETVNLKVKRALENNLKPIVCVGETLKQREEEKHFKIIKEQVSNCLKEINSDDIINVVIAYEPVWAIGTGKTASPEQANEMHIYIRNVIGNLFNKSAVEKIIILYGGSMNDKNAKELLHMSDIDGGLIGGASLKSESFINIINSAL
jgi:triosephosphate isomerase